MSICSDDTARLLQAMAQECCDLAERIAWLGGQVSSGVADSAALQSFDFLSQQAQALAMLSLLADRKPNGDQMVAAISRIPLPFMRARLVLALGRASAIVDDDDTILWIDA